MAKDKTPEIVDPMGMDFSKFEESALPAGGALVPIRPEGDRIAVTTFGDIVTAQRVAVPREITKVLAKMKVLAGAAGDRYVYRIPFKRTNKQTGDVKTEYVEGGSIKLANDLAREYGNCMINVLVDNSQPRYWIFYGKFVDLETGFTMVRAFQQRKSQSTGMKDVDRQEDMVFQIGQSKCIRNVTLNALQTMTDYCVEEAKQSVKERIAKDPNKARAWLLAKIAELRVDLKLVESFYGRIAAHWTVADMAKLYAEINSIEDGMVTPDDLYPTSEEGQRADNGSKQQPSKQKETTDELGKQAGEGEESKGTDAPLATPPPPQPAGPAPKGKPAGNGEGIPALSLF